MQIHSKHKDYYDGILYEISSLDHFVRTQDHRKKVTVGAVPEGVTKLPLDNRLQYLFFCGQLYPFLQSVDFNSPYNRNVFRPYSNRVEPVYTDKPSFLWSSEEITEYLEKHDQLSFCFTEQLVKTFSIQEAKLLQDVQLASGVCYFVFKPHYWYGYRDKLVASDIAGDLVLYPSLQDIQFYKVVDPYTAAQQIDYWLGNIFVSDLCINTQTDAEKIVAHGHDLKESFRTESGKGKKKNEKKRS